jgi:hypothetical protein
MYRTLGKQVSNGRDLQRLLGFRILLGGMDVLQVAEQRQMRVGVGKRKCSFSSKV